MKSRRPTTLILIASIVSLATLVPARARSGTAQPPSATSAVQNIILDTAVANSNWHIETVDSPVEISNDISLRLDEAHRPHISYHDRSDYSLKYAWHDGNTWQITTVDAGDGVAQVGEFNSLALDEAGQPHISYTHIHYFPHWPFIDTDLYYAWHDGYSWQIERVGKGRSASLALDSSDQPHLGYCRPSDFDPSGTLQYAWHDGTAWYIETVDSDGCQYVSLALNGAGRPHISYYSGGNLKFARHDGTAWHIETVDSDGIAGSYTSLALDGAGHAHISYYDELNGKLKYAYWTGRFWHTERVDSATNVGSHASLALDGEEKPHISYYDANNATLKYARYDGTVWRIETVGSAGTIGSATSMALDEAGRAHIGYYGGFDEGLKYARRLPNLSLAKQATPDEGLHNNDTLTYTLTLYGPGLSVRLSDPLPAAVRYVPDSLSYTVTPPALYSPTIGAVVWQGTLPTDTVSLIRFQVTPNITGTGSLDLALPVVNTAWLTDTANARGVSATVIVNGQYVYMPVSMRDH